MDIATKRGISIDVKDLARKLGLTVVETIGSRGIGRDRLRQAIMEEARCKGHTVQPIDYAALEPLISDLSLLVRDPASERQLPAPLARHQAFGAG